MSRQALGTAVAFACALVWVAVGVASDAVPEAAVGVPERPEPPRLLVLRSGKVVEGTICFAQGGYEVLANAQGARSFLPDSMVWFTARHRREAYEELCRRAPCRTADEHADMARWCMTNKLYSCAQDELRIALEQEPNHAGARSILKTLEALLRTGSPAPAQNVSAPPAAADGKEALGGMPSGTAKEFVTRVQPLLVNRCGNAACHGGSKNAFAFRVVRSGNPAYQRLTEQNLNAVLRQVSSTEPNSSPLLVEPQRPGHGGTRKPLFAGPAGDAQLRMLAAWVTAAANASPTEAPAHAEVAPSPLMLTGAAEAAVIGTATPAAGDSDEIAPAAGERDATSDLLQRALTEERPDKFDPEEFNRRYSPQAGRQSSPSSQGLTR